MTLTRRLQRAVALRDAATPGPWDQQFNYVTSSVEVDSVYPLSEKMHVCECMARPDGNITPRRRADAAFIAAAPSIVQLAVELGAECERLRMDAERYRWLRKHQHTFKVERSRKGKNLTLAVTPVPYMSTEYELFPTLDKAIDANIADESPSGSMSMFANSADYDAATAKGK